MPSPQKTNDSPQIPAIRREKEGNVYEIRTYQR